MGGGCEAVLLDHGDIAIEHGLDDVPWQRAAARAGSANISDGRANVVTQRRRQQALQAAQRAFIGHCVGGQ